LSGGESRAKLEEMLRQGYSMQEVLDHFMKHGKTEEEERKAHFQKLQVINRYFWAWFIHLLCILPI
jgi:hypothetical protein